MYEGNKKPTKQGKERTKAIVWDTSGFTVLCAKPNKIFFFFSITESIAFHPGKSVGFSLLLLCSLTISCLVLWPQLIFRCLTRTDLYVQILSVLDILNLLVSWACLCPSQRLCWSVRRSCVVSFQKWTTRFMLSQASSPVFLHPKPWCFWF